jgi:exodeoxyribonuclease V beta subunit
VGARLKKRSVVARKWASTTCCCADAALQSDSGERLAAVIREQFPVALIDEFQDTDPVQYRIFESIYRIEDNSPDTGLFLIGDPKQAIYAFRGADIYTYLRVRPPPAACIRWAPTSAPAMAWSMRSIMCSNAPSPVSRARRVFREKPGKPGAVPAR